MDGCRPVRLAVRRVSRELHRAKYSVVSIPAWIAVETGVGFVQYTLAGLFLGLAHGAEKRSSALNAG